MKIKMFKKLIINNLEQKLVLKIQLLRKILNHQFLMYCDKLESLNLLRN